MVSLLKTLLGLGPAGSGPNRQVSDRIKVESMCECVIEEQAGEIRHLMNHLAFGFCLDRTTAIVSEPTISERIPLYRWDWAVWLRRQGQHQHRSIERSAPEVTPFTFESVISIRLAATAAAPAVATTRQVQTTGLR